MDVGNIMKKQVYLKRKRLQEKQACMIHSSDSCDYCIHKGKREHCNPCYEHAGFDGRRVKEENKGV